MKTNLNCKLGYDLENNKIVPLQNDFYQEFVAPIENRENTSEALLVKSNNGFSLASYESIYKSNGERTFCRYFNHREVFRRAMIHTYWKRVICLIWLFMKCKYNENSRTIEY